MWGEAFPFHGPGNCGEVGLGGRRSEVLTVVASHHSVWDISDTHCLIVVANYSVQLGPVQQAGLVWALQNKFQLCCTLYQLFLHIVAVGGLCMPTNECSKGGELLVIWQLSTSSPTHDLTHATCLQTSKLLPAILLLCSPNRGPFVPHVS